MFYIRNRRKHNFFLCFFLLFFHHHVLDKNLLFGSFIFISRILLFYLLPAVVFFTKSNHLTVLINLDIDKKKLIIKLTKVAYSIELTRSHWE